MRAFIFDLDGVIVHTDRFHYRAWKQTADEMGIYFDEQINHRLRGISREQSLEIILEKYDGEPLSREQKQELMDRKNGYYRKLLGEMTPDDVGTEVRSTLGKLREAGYKLGVGSSSKNTKYILEKVELIKIFQAISDGTNIRKSKPDPEVFLKAAEFLHENPADCYVVEDAYAGIDAAKAAGCFSIGIGEAGKYVGADHRIGSFSELLEFLP